MAKRVCAGRQEGYYSEENSLELDGIDDDNIYKVERVVEERKRKVIHIYIIINIDQSYK